MPRLHQFFDQPLDGAEGDGECWAARTGPAQAPGQVVADQYVFEGTAAAQQVGVGLYNAANGQRVPVRDPGGQPLPEDRVLIK